jgi:hypothetical protein
VKVMSRQERRLARQKNDDAALERDFRVIAAIHSIVNQSVVRPGPNNRSQIFNDPNLAIISHLRSFPMAFHHSILKPAMAEAFEHGNVAPMLFMMTGFTAVMLVADWLRDWLRHGEEGAPWKENWTAADHLLYAAERAGWLYGRDALLFDAMTPALGGDIPEAAAQALGVTASHAKDMMTYGLSERELPFQDLWRHWG